MMRPKKWDGYCRATEEEDPCPDCGASVATGRCGARKPGPPPVDYGLRLVLVDRDTGELVT